MSVQHFPVVGINLANNQFNEESELNTTTITNKTSAYLPRADKHVKDYFKGKVKTVANVRYNIKLSIQYETEIGECLAVIGNIDQLGNWDDSNKRLMKWTEGHNWITEDLVTDKPFFLYKYVICRGAEIVRWEKGANRIADVEVLPDLTD